MEIRNEYKKQAAEREREAVWLCAAGTLIVAVVVLVLLNLIRHWMVL